MDEGSVCAGEYPAHIHQAERRSGPGSGITKARWHTWTVPLLPRRCPVDAAEIRRGTAEDRGWAACLAGIPGRQPGVPQQLVAWRLAQSGGQLSGLLEGTAVLQTLAQADADQVFLGSVGQLAMDGEVTEFKVGVGCAQAHEQAEPLEDEVGDDAVPDDDRRGGTRLDQQLLRVPVEQPGRGDVRGIPQP